MSVLEDLLTAIRDDLDARMPALRECEVHWGKFDLAELKKRGTSMPSVLVSTLGMKEDGRAAGGWVGMNASVVAYVTARSNGPLHSSTAAANIAQTILQAIAEKADRSWGLETVGGAGPTSLSVIDDVKVRSAGVTMMAVTWTQELTVTPIRDHQVLPLELYVSQAPDIGAAHEADYTQIGGNT